MIKKFFKNKGFSMVEVVVASVITTATIAMVFGTMMVSRRPMDDADKQMRAGIIARKAMAKLRDEVDANRWTTGNLQESGRSLYFTESDSGIDFQVYKVVVDDGFGGKKVSIEVGW